MSSTIRTKCIFVVRTAKKAAAKRADRIASALEPLPRWMPANQRSWSSGLELPKTRAERSASAK